MVRHVLVEDPWDRDSETEAVSAFPVWTFPFPYFELCGYSFFAEYSDVGRVDGLVEGEVMVMSYLVIIFPPSLASVPLAFMQENGHGSKWKNCVNGLEKSL